jgi:hypothetical protein
MNVDRSKLKQEYRDAAYVAKLEEFALAVYKAKPMLDFYVDDTCLKQTRVRHEDGTYTHTNEICRLKALDCGEDVGQISISTRYRNGESGSVYEVGSFRIAKSRGNQHSIQSKDIKIALRVAKKTLVSRADSELKDLIGNAVMGNLSAMHSSMRNQVRWDFDVESELLFMAMQGYEARQNGEDTYKLPSTPFSIKDLKKHDDKCENYKNWNTLYLAAKAKQGYGAMTRLDNSIVLFSLAQDTITHYRDYADLPPSIQEKFAMFKVLAENELYTHIGCKFKDGMYYIAP